MTATPSTSNQEFREIGRLIESVALPVRNCWQELLSDPKWGMDSEKLSRITPTIAARADSLSLVLHFLSGGELRYNDIESVLIRVRSIDYNIDHLDIELRGLKSAVRTILRDIDEISLEKKFDAYTVFCDACDTLLGAVLRETSVIYEKLVEIGARGFILVDQKGEVTYANPRMQEIAGIANLEGKSIYSYFEGEDRRKVEEILNSEPTNSTALQQLKWIRSEGDFKDLNAEVVSLDTGGYLALGDLGYIIDSRDKIFDSHPYAILEVNPNIEITYANHAANRLLGMNSCVAENFHSFLADTKDIYILSRELERRRRGESGDYPLKLRNRETEKPSEVRVVSVPRMDPQGGYVGSFVILEPLTLKKAAEQIHTALAEDITLESLFERTFVALSMVFDADCVFIAIISKDRKHVMTLYDSTQLDMETRWFPMSEQLRHWNEQNEVTAIGDLEEFLGSHDPELLQDSLVKQLIAEDMLSWLRYPVHDQGHIAMISIAARGRHRFRTEDESSMSELPLDKVLLKALRFGEKRELKLINTLSKEVQGSRSQKEIAQHLTRLLCENYPWQNVSFFSVDTIAQHFTLVAQYWDPESGFKLPDDYSQPLNAGILGQVHSNQKPQRYSNVQEEVVFCKMDPRVRSALCVPVRHNDHTYGYLNIEHSQINAFSVDDQELMQGVAQEAGAVLERLSWQHMLNAAFDQVQDAVFFVDSSNTILRSNRSAKDNYKLLDGFPLKVFGHYFEDVAAAERFLEAREDYQYCGNFLVNGVQIYATATKVRMPRELPGFLIALTDSSLGKRERELTEIHHRFEELAREIKTPLSLASSFLVRLRKSFQNPEHRDYIERVLEQLSEVDVGFESILYSNHRFVKGATPTIFTVADLVEHRFSHDIVLQR